MRPLHILIAAAAATAAVPAMADVLIGTSPARACYEAAESERKPSSADFAVCTEALAHPKTTADQIVASHVNRGILHLRAGRIDAALADFDRASSLDPSEPETYLNRGTALMKRSQASRALSEFNEALAKKTQRPALAYFGRGVAHETLGNIEAAYRDYRMATELAPEWEDPRAELRRFRIVR